MTKDENKSNPNEEKTYYRVCLDDVRKIIRDTCISLNQEMEINQKVKDSGAVIDTRTANLVTNAHSENIIKHLDEYYETRGL